METSEDGKKFAKILALNFSPLFHLHCYRQVASIFTFISDYFVKLLLLKCLRSIETKKLHVRSVVPKLQKLVLPVTRRDVQLEQCFAPNVPISPRNPEMIWITILLRSIAPQNLMLPSSVNFVIKSFEDFTLYVNIERNADRIRNNKCGCGTYSGRCWRSQNERRVAFLSTFLGAFGVWKTETQIIQLRSGNFQRNNREWETWSFFQQSEMCSKSESGFWLHFEKYRRRMVQIFVRTRKQYPAGSIQTWVHPWRLGKVERFSQPNLQTDVIESCSRERTNTKWRFYKLTNLTVFAALLKDVPMGCKNAVLPEPLLRYGTINCLTFEESTREPYNDNLCLFRALALHLHGTQRLEVETSKLFNLFIKKMDGLSADHF